MRGAFLGILTLTSASCATLSFSGDFNPSPTTTPGPSVTPSPTPTATIGPGRLALVQHGNGKLGSTGMELIVSLPANTHAGDLVVAAVEWGATTAAAAANDDQGDLFQTIAIEQAPSGDHLVLFYQAAVSSGASLVFVTTSAAVDIRASVAEFSGARSTPLETFAVSSGSSLGPHCGPVALSGTSLLFAAVGQASAFQTVTPGAGFTALDNPVAGLSDEYRLNVPVGSTGAGFGLSASNNWACISAGFN